MEMHLKPHKSLCARDVTVWFTGMILLRYFKSAVYIFMTHRLNLEGYNMCKKGRRSVLVIVIVIYSLYLYD